MNLQDAQDDLKTALEALESAKAQVIPSPPKYINSSFDADLEFELDGGFNKSAEAMVKNIGFKSVRHYYNACRKYERKCQEAVDNFLDGGDADDLIDAITQATIKVKQLQQVSV